MPDHQRDVDLMDIIFGSPYMEEDTSFYHSFEEHQASGMCACVSNSVHVPVL